MAYRRNANLDALRGVAILLVVGHHLNVIPLWTRIGWSGVDLFFVLSGYLISGLLFEEWKATGAIDFKRFFLRRGFKIYPGFYVLIAVSLVANAFLRGVTSFPVTLRSVLGELTFTQNYVGGIWGQTWTLAVEEHFYLLLPAVLLLMASRAKRGTDPFRWIPTLFLWIGAIELALRFWFTWHLSGVADEARYLEPTHLRIDSLFFGVLLGYMRHFQPEQFRQYASTRAPLFIIALMLVFVALVPLPSPVMHTIGFSLLYFGYGFLLVRVVDAPQRALVKPLAQIGVYSYSIYLWHGLVCRVLPHQTVMQFFVGLAACLGLGIAMAKAIEYPALALRDRLFPSRTRATPAGEAEELPVTAQA